MFFGVERSETRLREMDPGRIGHKKSPDKSGLDIFCIPRSYFFFAAFLAAFFFGAAFFAAFLAAFFLVAIFCEFNG